MIKAKRKYSVLFVDDEEHLLSGLKRMLRGARDTLEFEFAPGGPEAIKLLESRCYDIVITDMKMPEADGADVLAAVRHHCPYSVRIVLSGQAEEEAILRVIDDSHQYLAKPCNPEVLMQRIEKACKAREVVIGYDVKLAVAKTNQLPVREESYARLQELLEETNPAIRDVQQVFETDICLGARALKLANSAYFTQARPTNSIRQAVAFLGVDSIRKIAADSSSFTPLKRSSITPYVDTMTSHSIRIAGIMQRLALNEGCNEEEVATAYTIGLLHEMGRLILYAALPSRYSIVQELVIRNRLSLAEAEREVFGTYHETVCAYQLALWNMSNGILRSIEPALSNLSESTEAFLFSELLAIAHEIEDELPLDLQLEEFTRRGLTIMGKEELAV
jgi:HD-like signal output (HDOD) protein/CheY-like chemotaxis protein